MINALSAVLSAVDDNTIAVAEFEFVRTFIRRRENFLTTRKFIGPCDFFEKLDQLDAVVFVQRSSTLELSSRFFGRLNFSLREDTVFDLFSFRFHLVVVSFCFRFGS